MHDADVLVLGGGFAGLIAARDLSHAGLRVTLLEARDRLGGRTYTRPFADTDVDVEVGGTWILPDYEDAVMAELARYGIGTGRSAPVRVARTIVGGAVLDAPEPPDADLEPLRRAVAAGPAGDADDVDVLTLLERFGPTDVTRDWVVAWTRFLNGDDPAQLSARGSIGTGLGEKGIDTYEVTIAGGTRALIDAIAADARADLRLSTPVVAVTQSADGVTVRTAGGEELTARAAVVTVPMNLWSTIDFTPALAPPLAGFAAEGQRGRSMKVWALVRGVPEDLRVAGVVGDGVLTYLRTHAVLPEGNLMVGFGASPEALDLADPAQIERAVRELLPDAEVVAVDGHDWVRDPWARGAWWTPRVGRWDAGTDGASEALQGRIVFAGGDVAAPGPHGDLRGCIEGAIVSAHRAAQKVERLLA